MHIFPCCMLHQREQTGYRAAGTRTQTGRRGAHFS
nr:MAG TPA: hypothetical protein [Caudoviricetes sp.]